MPQNSEATKTRDQNSWIQGFQTLSYTGVERKVPFRGLVCISFWLHFVINLDQSSWRKSLLAMATVYQSGVRMLGKSRNAQYLNTSELPGSWNSGSR